MGSTLMKPIVCEVRDIVSILSKAVADTSAMFEHSVVLSIYLLRKLLGAQRNSFLSGSLQGANTDGIIVHLNLTRVEVILSTMYEGDASSHIS